VCAINVKTTLAVVFAFIGYLFDENLLFDQNGRIAVFDIAKQRPQGEAQDAPSQP
jgi:hypothetical protein